MTKAMPKFRKEDVLRARKYRRDVDVLQVALEDGKEYTEGEIERALKTFKERKVR